MSEKIRSMLESFRSGDLDADSVIEAIAREPFETFSIGRIDHLREARTGVAEVILAEGKEPEQVREVMVDYLERGERIFATRVRDDVAEALRTVDELHRWERAGVWSTFEPETTFEMRPVAIVSAGALDVPVAEEAAISAQLMGLPIERVYDVGVAGLNRLLPEVERLRACSMIIVVAGMDGALPSVLSGLLPQPLVAVPTSVGYGAAFGGIAPLLTMLNTCSPGPAVMNIDNGFGAAVHARKVALALARARA
jgi:NCAIR mutase (PurE)-related protein